MTNAQNESVKEYAEMLCMTEEELVQELSKGWQGWKGKSPIKAVVKISGACLEENDSYDLEAVCSSLCVMQGILSLAGSGLVVVHGAGSQLDKAVQEAGLQNKKVKGLRYTDNAINDIVQAEVLKIGEKLAKTLNSYGAKTLKMPKTIIKAESLGSEYGGYAGKPVGIDCNWMREAPYSLWLKEGHNPIYISGSNGVECTPSGKWKTYNINADDVAAALAAAFKPKVWINVTPTGGVLADTANKSGVVPELTIEQAMALSTDGMAVKIGAIKEAIEKSPKTKVIITSPQGMAYALFKANGTEIKPNAQLYMPAK